MVSSPLPGAIALAATLLLAGGCASSGPYWNAADREAAEATEQRERLERAEAEATAVRERELARQAEAAALEAERLRASEIPAESAATAIVDEPAVTGERSEIEQSDLEDLDPPAVLSPGDAGMAPAPGSPASDTADGPQGLYDRSLMELDAGRVAAAEEGFQRFLAENPTSDLADNAQFWLAESALRRTDVDTALAGFRAVVENYPEGNKLPDALLKVGACLALLGEAESAATVYRELLTRFPETAAAEIARARLATP